MENKRTIISLSLCVALFFSILFLVFFCFCCTIFDFEQLKNGCAWNIFVRFFFQRIILISLQRFEMNKFCVNADFFLSPFSSSSSPFPRNELFSWLFFSFLSRLTWRCSDWIKIFFCLYVYRTNERTNEWEKEWSASKDDDEKEISGEKHTKNMGEWTKQRGCSSWPRGTKMLNKKRDRAGEPYSRVDRLAMEKTCCCRFYCISVGVAWSHSKDCSTLKSFICSTKPNKRQTHIETANNNK